MKRNRQTFGRSPNVDTKKPRRNRIGEGQTNFDHTESALPVKQEGLCIMCELDEAEEGQRLCADCRENGPY